jgi:hypothetical protein
MRNQRNGVSTAQPFFITCSPKCSGKPFRTAPRSKVIEVSIPATPGITVSCHSLERPFQSLITNIRRVASIPPEISEQVIDFHSASSGEPRQADTVYSKLRLGSRPITLVLGFCAGKKDVQQILVRTSYDLCPINDDLPPPLHTLNQHLSFFYFEIMHIAQL